MNSIGDNILRWAVGLLFVGLLLPNGRATAQWIAMKSNLLYDATTTINLGVEARMAPKWSAEISANLNPWTFSDNRKMRHLLVQPEVRWWSCEAFNGHFIGVHGHWARYNWGGMLPWGFRTGRLLGNDGGPMATHRYEGWLVGAGVTYGYQWLLGRHWNLEAAIGVGYAHMRYDIYPCQRCGRRVGRDTRNYFGPTKAAVSLIYVF